jgi:hypothetical protein
MKTVAAALQNTARSLMGRLLLGCKTEAKLEQSVARMLGLMPRTSGLTSAPVKLKQFAAGESISCGIGGASTATTRFSVPFDGGAGRMSRKEQI